MILANIARALKEQNWTAVVIEFLIVVLGVVIGFQFTAWNAERQTQAETDDLLDRLHDEIIDVETARIEWREGVPPHGMLETLRAISPLLLGEADPDRSLTPAECNVVVRSHIFALPPQALPILDELESTGGIRLIEDEAARTALTNLQQRFDRTEILVAQLMQNINPLATSFPDAIQHAAPDDPQSWIPIFNGDVRCDLAAIRADRSFLNQYVDNVSRYVFYVDSAVVQTDARLAELHAAVDAALGTSHEEAEP